MKKIPFACAWFAIAVGAAVLCGWVFGFAPLKTILPGFVTMKANTALAFVLAGGALILLSASHASRARVLTGQSLALLVAVIGMLTLGEELFGWRLGIDELLIRDADAIRDSTSATGRMPVSTAIAFVLLGLAQLSIDWTPRRRLRFSDLLAALVIGLSLVATGEHVLGRTPVGTNFEAPRMALHSILTFAILGLGVLLARPDLGVLGAIRARMTDTLERRVYAALALSLLALAAAGLAGLYTAGDAIERSARVDHTHEVRRNLALFASAHKDLETGQRGFVITGKEEFLQPFETARESSDRIFDALVALLRDNPKQIALLRDNPKQIARLQPLSSLRVRQLVWTTRVVELRRTHGLAAAEAMITRGDGRRLMDELRALIEEMDLEEARRLALYTEEERASIARLYWTLAVSSLFGLLVLGFAGTVIHIGFGRRQRADAALQELNQQLEQHIRERTAALRASEAQLRTIFDSLSEGVVVSGLDGQIQEFNRAAVDMFGFSSREEYLRALPAFVDTFELSTPEGQILSVDQWPLSRVLRGEVLHELELDTRHLRTGRRRIFSYGGMLVRGTDSMPLLAVLTVRDVTERGRAERRIRAQLEHLNLLDQITRATGERQDMKSIFQVVVRTVEDSLPVDFGCVCLYDPAAHVLRVTSVGAKSEALADALTMNEQAVIDVDANGLARAVQGELVYEPDAGRLRFPFPTRLAGAGLASVVMAPLRSESRVFGVLIVARRQANGFSSTECEFLRQLSEHVALSANQAQLYESLQLAYDELRQTQAAALQEERLRALGQMASGIAHDINNALSPVSLYTESLLDTEPDLSVRTRDYLETIRRAVDDVAETVARMREFYRKREQQIELAPVDANQMIRQVLDLTKVRWSDMAQQHGITIQALTELAPDLPLIMGVESEIREALTNLVFNAVDAMPEGGTLTLRTRRGGVDPGSFRLVHLEVSDTGVGMDEQTRERCLEPFFTTKGEQGTGLGLAMVFGMAQRHSAGFEIESTPGAGTTMGLVFEVQNADATNAVRPAAIAARSHLHLLLVDDDPILLKSLRATLEADSHSIITANGGEAGISAFRASLERGERIDAVITDLGMPYVDGRRVASAIKAVSPATPVIMLTGWGRRLVAEGDIPPHVDRVLAKPPKLRELREALAQLCGEGAKA